MLAVIALAVSPLGFFGLDALVLAFAVCLPAFDLLASISLYSVTETAILLHRINSIAGKIINKIFCQVPALGLFWF